MEGWTCGKKKGWLDGRTDGQSDGGMGRKMNGRMERRMNEWLTEWLVGWLNKPLQSTFGLKLCQTLLCPVKDSSFKGQVPWWP